MPELSSKDTIKAALMRHQYQHTLRCDCGWTAPNTTRDMWEAHCRHVAAVLVTELPVLAEED